MSSGPVRRLLERRRGLVAVASLALAWGATLLVPPWSDESVGDLGSRSDDAELMLAGELPYRDFGFEYPPLAAPAIALPGLAGGAEDDYRLGSAAFTFLLAIAVLLLLLGLARRTRGRPWPVVLALATTPLLLGAVVRLHFDLVAVVLLVAALLLLLAGRPALGMAMLALGALTKGFPLVVTPVALAWLWGTGGRGQLRDGVLGLLLPLAVIGAAWAAFSPDGAGDALSYQLDRPLQIESSPASVLLLAGALGGSDPAAFDSHATVGLEHPLDTVLALVFAAALVAAITAATTLTALALRRLATGERSQPSGSRRAPTAPRTRAAGTDPTATRALVLGTACAVAASVAFGRVLSPQYLLWLVPLFALAAAWRMRALALACAAAFALTQAEFPSRYFELVAREPLAVSITAARNAALVVAAALALLELWRLSTGARAGSAAGGRGLTPTAAAPAQPSAPGRPAPLR